MQKELQIFVIVSLLLAVAVSQKALNATCYSCGISTCNSTYCYNLTGSGISETVCAPQGANCAINQVVQVTVDKCSVDYSSTNCSTGVCFFVANQPIALLGTTSCAGTASRNYSCAVCTNISCPTGNCQVVRNNGNPQQNCIDSCPTVPAVNLTISQCANGRDFLGQSNACCMTFDGTAGPVCTTQNTVLTSSSKLLTWVKGSN